MQYGGGAQTLCRVVSLVSRILYLPFEASTPAAAAADAPPPEVQTPELYIWVHKTPELYGCRQQSYIYVYVCRRAAT
jgi:hypothetical protein